MSELRVSSIICPLCKTAIVVERLGEMGVDTGALSEELLERRMVTPQLSQLHRRLNQHQEDHACCARAHSCTTELPIVRPAWWPW